MLFLVTKGSSFFIPSVPQLAERLFCTLWLHVFQTLVYRLSLLLALQNHRWWGSLCFHNKTEACFGPFPWRLLDTLLGFFSNHFLRTMCLHERDHYWWFFQFSRTLCGHEISVCHLHRLTKCCLWWHGRLVLGNILVSAVSLGGCPSRRLLRCKCTSRSVCLWYIG